MTTSALGQLGVFVPIGIDKVAQFVCQHANSGTLAQEKPCRPADV